MHIQKMEIQKIRRKGINFIILAVETLDGVTGSNRILPLPMKSSAAKVLLFQTVKFDARRPSTRGIWNFSWKLGFLPPSVQVRVRNLELAYPAARTVRRPSNCCIQPLLPEQKAIEREVNRSRGRKRDLWRHL